MADHAAFQKLATQLLKATQQGKVKWSDTADEEMFRATFKEAAIRVVKLVDDERGPDLDTCYQIILLNKEGRIADESLCEHGGGEISKLFHEARRSARNSSSAIESIFEELSKA